MHAHVINMMLTKTCQEKDVNALASAGQFWRFQCRTGKETDPCGPSL
jgi:hypothetical protein